MSEASKALDAVAALMRERQKYEQWMETLEAKRANSPEHVFARVMADYERRLRDVMQRLGEHSPVLEEQARTLDARLETLGADERRLRDQRAEAELRAAVGELTSEEWDSLARESDGHISRLESEQAELRGELAQVRELLAAATTPPRALTPIASAVIPEEALPATPVAASFEEPAVEIPVAVAPAPEPAPAPATVPAPRPGTIDHMEAIDAPSVPTPAASSGASAFDELAFLESVAADEVPPMADAAPSRVQAAPVTARAATPLSAPAQPAPRPIDPSLGIVVQEGITANALAGTRRSGATPMSANVTGAQPIVIRSETAQTKTLKCTDCGAMNFPTEWYCERCGAELAAL